MRRTSQLFIGIVGAVLASCAMPESRAVAERISTACSWPSAAESSSGDSTYVLKVWRFPLERQHSATLLPNEPGLLAYRDAMHAAGVVERYPTLHVPPARDEAEARVWQDEAHNNSLAYTRLAGSIEPITCLDALLFAEQNARVPQVDRPSEFLASVLRKETSGRQEVVVVFGAGSGVVPPSPAYGTEIVDAYLVAGWRYWYALHNHTRQANGSLGVPVPSTSDVQLVRNLARDSRLERVRVTNGLYTFDAAVAELADFRAR